MRLWEFQPYEQTLFQLQSRRTPYSSLYKKQKLNSWCSSNLKPTATRTCIQQMARKQRSQQGHTRSPRSKIILSVSNFKKREASLSFSLPISKGNKKQLRYLRAVRKARKKANQHIRNDSSLGKTFVYSSNRQSRARNKVINSKRNDSVPDRRKKLKIDVVKRFPEINPQGEDDINEESSKQWLCPFIDNESTTPQIQLKVDGKTTESTIDTGASRVMCTSALAQKIWGKNVFSKLTSYGNRVVTDAQNKPVKVLGIKQAEIQMGSYLKTTFPIVVYQALHEELLIGYTILARFKLAVYCGKGLGTQPEMHTVKRFNFCQK